MTAAPPIGFAIGVRYVTGYAAAASVSGEPEWPPHPARLFMALVATCYDTGGDTDELAALRWLEEQPPPEIVAAECDHRSSVEVYVPPNDFTARDPNILPQWRTKRQPRRFPRVRPHDERVDFIWPSPSPIPDALARLCEKVTRLGHSSSLVQVWLHDGRIDTAGRHTYRPGHMGVHRLRRINPGTLDYLQHVYREADIEDHFQLNGAVEASKGKAKKQAESAYLERFGRPWKRGTPPPERLRPELSVVEPYERVTAGDEVGGSWFDPSIVVLRLSPKKSRFRRLAASSTPCVCDVFRKAVQSHAPDDLALVSGHAPNGSPLRSPHMAVFPLLFVGGTHADGHLLGIAAALPRGEHLSSQERLQTVTAIQRVRSLTLGDLGEWEIGPVSFDESRETLKPRRWTGADAGSTCWATVTPISLDRHPKAKDPAEQQEELAESIRAACAAVGLSEPTRIVPFPVSAFVGVPDAGRFPRLARKDGSNRRQTHAILWFDKPVVGPVLLGAGRFRGWGVCRPYHAGA